MTYPDEVAGLILVDAVHQDLLRFVPLPSIEYFQLTLCGVYLGIFRLLAHVPIVRKIMAEQIEKFPLDVQDMYYSQSTTTKFIHAVHAEAVFAEESCGQLRKAGKSLGDIPLSVISAGNPLMVYEEVKGVYSLQEVDAMNEGWSNLQRDLVKKSSRARHIIAENSGHMIPVDRPDVIIQVVHDMVDQLNTTQS